VNSWPTNPVSHYISKFTSYPPKTIIADLGCGEAALARALLPHSIAVLSFDLVSDGVYTVEADICARVPLPGSEGSVGEKGEGEGAIVDVVVCALSLMGTNWVRCILEAWRILKPGYEPSYLYLASSSSRSNCRGELHIAEVASRFTDVNSFVSLVCTVGFRLVSKVGATSISCSDDLITRLVPQDDENTHFTLFEFRKVSRKGRSEQDWARVIERGAVLKPCEYKRR
jgi:ribosomal RNA-processing protein 8